MGAIDKETGVTPNEELFLSYYCDPANKATYGNATKSWVAVRPDIKPTSARVDACRILAKENVKKRRREILDSMGFNDENVDSQLLKVINQDDDKSSKVSAIDKYYKVSGRYVKEEGNTINIDQLNMQIINNNPEYGMREF